VAETRYSKPRCYIPQSECEFYCYIQFYVCFTIIVDEAQSIGHGSNRIGNGGLMM
jgi:hypothetical protein